MSETTSRIRTVSEKWASTQLPSSLVVLVSGVILTLILYLQVHDEEHISMQRELASWAEEHATALQAGIDASIQIVDSLHRLHAASKNIDPQEFQAFVAPALTNPPQLQALLWIPRISHAERETFEQAARATGLRGFQIIDRTASGTAPAMVRAEYYPIHYIAPLTGNEAALGLDIASQPLRVPLLASARDSGELLFSEPFTPAQNTNGQLTIAVHVPVYQSEPSQMTIAQRRESLRGFMTGLFRIEDLVEEAMSGMTHTGLDFELYDATVPQDRIRLYRQFSRPTDDTGADRQRLQQQVPLEVPGRSWVLHFYATPEFLERYHSHTSDILLAVGLLFSTITSLYLFVVLRRKAEMAQLANELTFSNRSLEASGRRLADLIEAAPMAIMVVDHEGKLTNWNPAAEKIFGWNRDEVLGSFPPHMQANDAKHYQPVGEGETVMGIEGLRLRKDGSKVYIRASGAPLLNANSEVTGMIALIEDRSDFYHTRQALEWRDAILIALQRVARLLLQTERYAPAMSEVLQVLGEATRVDRVYLFRNHTANDGSLLASQLHEWCAKDITPQIDNPELQNLSYLEAGLARWVTLLQAGEVVLGDIADFPETEQALLRSQDILSLLVVPIRVDNNWWGMIGFDCCTQRDWDPEQVHLLQIAADSLGAAIRREDYEQRLRQAALVFDNTVEGVTITDAKGLILDVNRAYTEITGYSREEAIGHKPSLIKSDRHDADFYRSMWAVLLRDGLWSNEIWDRRKNGEVFPARLTISAVPSPGGKPSHYVGVLSDLTALRSTEDRLDYLAHHDPLTDLPNRRLLQLQLQQAFHHAKFSGAPMALLLLDIDHFKDVNDSLGHLVGDELLKSFASRLLEESPDQGFVARVGGDEFAVLLEHISGAQQAAEVAQNLLSNANLPFTISGQELFANTSIGISLYPENGIDAEVLLRNADTAMHRAKDLGRARYQFYTQDLTNRAYERMSLLAQLRRGVDKEQFQLHYQPQIHLQTGRIIGAEALVRWEHPELGMVSPADFIPLAEESGLIIPLGEWVLRTACKQAVSWCAGDSGFRRIAVNVAGPQVRPEFIRSVQAALAETGLSPACLELEVTEGFIMGHADDAIDLLTALKSLDVKLAIDDFGTGYSSLSYLKRMPIDKLKIDQSFVRGIPNAEDEAIACAIIALGKSLGLSVIAEGIETAQQRDFLHAQQCDQGQGFLYSRPVPADAFVALLREQDVIT